MFGDTMNKEKIADSFEKMMNSHFIDDISVKDIMNYCQLPRTVFYRYFHDKYDLMAYVYTSQIKRFISDSQTYTYQDMVRVCYTFMYEKKGFFSKIVKYKNQNSFLQFLNDYSYHTTKEAICRSYNIRELELNLDISLRLYCNGCSTITEWWLESGLKMPVEQISEIITNSIPVCLKDYITNLTY